MENKTVAEIKIIFNTTTGKYEANVVVWNQSESRYSFIEGNYNQVETLLMNITEEITNYYNTDKTEDN